MPLNGIPLSPNIVKQYIENGHCNGCDPFSNPQSYCKVFQTRCAKGHRPGHQVGFWEEFGERYCGQSRQDGTPEEERIRQTIAECVVGEFGVCVEDETDRDHFRYYIAGAYQGGEGTHCRQSIPEFSRNGFLEIRRLRSRST